MREEPAIEFIARGVCLVENRLLLCRRKGAPRSYLPGGHIDFGEGARTALRREIGEELGRPAVVGRFLGALEHRYENPRGRPACEINLVFEFRVRGFRADAAPTFMEPHIGFEWMPLSRLARSDLEPWPLRRLLRRWRANPGAAGWGSSYPEERSRR